MLVPDGNDEIVPEIPRIAEIIARTALWVNPETFKELPVWSPWAARGRPLYDKTWQRPYTNTRRDNGAKSPRYETNVTARKDFIAALGVDRPIPKNWTVCHIWGFDDSSFQSQGRIVKNPRYYSCVGNMVWLPTPLKGFTDALPLIKRMLRTCAFHLYGWAPKDAGVKVEAKLIRSGKLPPGYPATWPCRSRPTMRPLGMADFTAVIKERIERRKAKIRASLADKSLTHFPRKDVGHVLEFWNIAL